MVVSLHSGIKVGCSVGRTFAHTQDAQSSGTGLVNPALRRWRQKD